MSGFPPTFFFCKDASFSCLSLKRGTNQHKIAPSSSLWVGQKMNPRTFNSKLFLKSPQVFAGVSVLSVFALFWD